MFENFSLFFLTIGMGALDGFNVCSLGALILILSIVLSFKSQKLVLLAGGTFVLTTVLAYGALILFWHRIFVYLSPYQTIFELFLGTATLVGGLYFLKIFINAWRFGPTCSVQGGGVMSWAIKNVEISFKKGGYVAIFLGVVLFATIVTIIEFPCSAALPLAFVGILADAGVVGTAVWPFVVLYLSVYMVDELIVFFIALFAKRLWSGSPKFILISSFLGAILLLLIALHYLFGVPVPFL